MKRTHLIAIALVALLSIAVESPAQTYYNQFSTVPCVGSTCTVPTYGRTYSTPPTYSSPTYSTPPTYSSTPSTTTVIRRNGVLQPFRGSTIVRATSPAVDYAKIIEQMSNDPRFRGEAGRDGVDGQPGNDGRPGADADTVTVQLTEDDRRQIVDAIYDRLAADVVKLNERIGKLETATITIEQFDVAGGLTGTQSRTLVGDRATPFYFGRRQARPRTQPR